LRSPTPTRWHRIFGKLLKELLTPLGIIVQTDVIVTSDPQADVILIRKQGKTWTTDQKFWLPDGIRDSTASQCLIEFKMTESLSDTALLQACSYDLL
jgi:hypothetical protein